MSEVLGSAVHSLDEYQRLVVATRREDHPDDWRTGYFHLIYGEHTEFMGQHGPGMLLLLHGVNREEVFGLYPDLRDGIAEEIGDLLWFDFSAATLLGVRAKDLSADALKAHTGERFELESFADLEAAVCDNAHQIKVLSKMGMYYPELPPGRKFVSLLENPFYLFNRTTFRVTRALTEGKLDTPPFTASETEPVSSPELALGDHINTLAYVAQVLGYDIGEVAKANIGKLQRRAIYGKKQG